MFAQNGPKLGPILGGGPRAELCLGGVSPSPAGGRDLHTASSPPSGGAAGFKGLSLTATRPEKRQCSTCCHDFRNRVAWNPYKTSKNTRFFYWFAKNAARNRVRPGRGEPCLLSRFPHFPRLRPCNTLENTVFHRKAYQTSSSAGTVEAKQVSIFSTFAPAKNLQKHSVFARSRQNWPDSGDNIPSIPRITGLIRINVRHGCGRCR